MTLENRKRLYKHYKEIGRKTEAEEMKKRILKDQPNFTDEGLTEEEKAEEQEEKEDEEDGQESA